MHKTIKQLSVESPCENAGEIRQQHAITQHSGFKKAGPLLQHRRERDQCVSKNVIYSIFFNGCYGSGNLAGFFTASQDFTLKLSAKQSKVASVCYF